MSSAPVNLQDAFLNILRKENITTTVFLANRFQIRGKIKGFDNFTIVMDVDGKTQLVYKHVISTIAPSRPINLDSLLKENNKPAASD